MQSLIYLWRRVLNKILQRVNREICVLRYDLQRHEERGDLDASVTFDIWQTMPDVPDKILAEITLSEEFKAVRDERFRVGGRLCTAVIDDEVATFMWAKSGSRTPRWYVALEPEDVVLYGMYTFPKYRGRGLIGQLVAYTVDQEHPPAGDFYADVRVTNTISLQALRKIGFVDCAKTTLGHLIPTRANEAPANP